MTTFYWIMACVYAFLIGGCVGTRWCGHEEFFRERLKAK